MKKILSILGAVGLVASSSATVVACDNGGWGTDVELDLSDSSSTSVRKQLFSSIGVDTSADDWDKQYQEYYSDNKNLIDDYVTIVKNNDAEAGEAWLIENVQDNPNVKTDLDYVITHTKSGEFYFAIDKVDGEGQAPYIIGYGSITIKDFQVQN